MRNWERVAFVSVLVLSFALIAAPWRGHVDDIDAQMYTVVVRNMVADRTWFDLRYLPDLLPEFREHLPFGFWPAAAAMRWAGEWAVAPLHGLFTLGTIIVAGVVALRLFGPAAAIAAALCLGTCESIWQYGGRLLLDPPLLLFSTAAAGVLLVERPRWVLAAGLGAVAVLMKGPFGLVPMLSVSLARAMDRNRYALVRCGLACALALLPAAAFLAADCWTSEGTWCSGYLHDQVLASAIGARADGVSAWWFPLRVAAGRYWPGLPLLVTAAVAARRDRRIATISFASLIGIVLLCLPSRKWGNHVYVVFPLFAIASGAGAAAIAGRWFAESDHPRKIAVGLVCASIVAWCASLLGAGKLVLQPPCVVSTEFATALARYPPGASVWVGPPVNWALAGELAEELRLVPTSVPAKASSAELLVLPEAAPRPPRFRELSRGRGLVLLARVR